MDFFGPGVRVWDGAVGGDNAMGFWVLCGVRCICSL